MNFCCQCNGLGSRASVKRLVIVGLLTASLLAGVAHAHSYWSLDHSCSQPSKPFEFNSQWEVDQFNMDVEEYKRCIQDFVDEQNDAIANHGRAAEEAVDEWNNFVNYELN